MMTFVFPGIAFAIAMFVVFRVIPLVKSIALKYRQFDLPNNRKVHQKPMVRLGGLAIFVGTFLAILVVYALGGFATATPGLWGVILGSCGFFFVGLVDDLIGLSAMTRLALQVGIAGGAWYMGVRIEFVTLPGMALTHLGLLSLPLTVLWLTGVVNAINWIDGLDGLASGVSAIAIGTMFVICLFTNQAVAALLSAALLGSLLGFLYFNFNPAQIFMGDGGAYLVGFMMASVSVMGLAKSAVVTAILLPLIILAVPILDMSAVIFNRLRHGKSPFKADQRHLHHRLLRAGLTHRFTVLVIYALSLWAGSVAIVCVGIPNALIVLLLATVILGCTTWRAWRVIRQA
jgi:UDP-GlcNAc:undecaprenyl-phosphate/decaprenyl-phosphate GlcNAc-1-phosphate transferase